MTGRFGTSENGEVIEDADWNPVRSFPNKSPDGRWLALPPDGRRFP